ncbi:hypothetical protein B0H12DRAFT_491354 [Mycena haematopus]|nr:hypothetical protein B0H12DRAFT_491354 [Mycena haematopus]
MPVRSITRRSCTLLGLRHRHSPDHQVRSTRVFCLLLSRWPLDLRRMVPAPNRSSSDCTTSFWHSNPCTTLLQVEIRESSRSLWAASRFLRDGLLPRFLSPASRLPRLGLARSVSVSVLILHGERCFPPLLPAIPRTHGLSSHSRAYLVFASRKHHSFSGWV